MGFRHICFWRFFLIYREIQWYNFIKLKYLTYLQKQNIVHGVTCDTVSKHQYISHVYWNRILYVEWHVIKFKNISISHINIKQIILHGVICGTVSEHLYTYLTYLLKQNIVHGVKFDTVSEHQYISHVYWNRIFYMEWHVIQIQNINISHMYFEREYFKRSHVIQFQNISISQMHI